MSARTSDGHYVPSKWFMGHLYPEPENQKSFVEIVDLAIQIYNLDSPDEGAALGMVIYGAMSGGTDPERIGKDLGQMYRLIRDAMVQYRKKTQGDVDLGWPTEVHYCLPSPCFDIIIQNTSFRGRPGLASVDAAEQGLPSVPI